MTSPWPSSPTSTAPAGPAGSTRSGWRMSRAPPPTPTTCGPGCRERARDLHRRPPRRPGPARRRRRERWLRRPPDVQPPLLRPSGLLLLQPQHHPTFPLSWHRLPLRPDSAVQDGDGPAWDPVGGGTGVGWCVWGRAVCAAPVDGGGGRVQYAYKINAVQI
jgi:hypothetical protein